VPESFAAVIDRAVRRQADERWPSAAELRSALDEVARVFLPHSSVRETGDPDRVAVARSFARVREQGDPFVSRFYELLFAQEAATRALFPVQMGPQREKLLHMLDLATSGLDEPEHIRAVLTDLGRRHLHYSVLPAHFRALERALIGALSEFDSAWNEELERAWRRGISFIENAMLGGMDSERHTIGTQLSVAVPRWPRTPPATPEPSPPPEPERPPSVPAEPIRTRYALNGDLSLAYQTFGSGPIDIVVLLGWLSHVELNWQHPSLASFLKRIAKLGRVLVFDKRGTGLSDRSSETASLQDRMDDLQAVLKHAGIERPLFVGISEGGAIASMYAALHPESTRGLVVYGGSARMLVAPDYPWGHPPEFLDFVDNEIRQHWGDPVFVGLEAPSMAGDPAFCDWLGLYMRMSASPGNAIAMLRVNAQFDVRDVLPKVAVPALVLHRETDMVEPFAGGQYFAERLPHARFVPLKGSDHLPFVGDTESILSEIERFVPTLPEAPSTAPGIRFVLGVAGDDLEFASRLADKLKAPVLPGEEGLALVFDGPVRAARAALAITAEAQRNVVAAGLSIDAGPLDASLTARVIEAARRRIGELPTVTALVADLAVGANLAFVRLRDESGEAAMFALEPG